MEIPLFELLSAKPLTSVDFRVLVCEYPFDSHFGSTRFEFNDIAALKFLCHKPPSVVPQLSLRLRLILYLMFDPDAHMPKINRGMVYLGACLIAGIRLARERQVNVRVLPTSHAIDESVELAYEIFNRVFRRVPGVLERK